jgi:hypothetical protein
MPEIVEWFDLIPPLSYKATPRKPRIPATAAALPTKFCGEAAPVKGVMGALVVGAPVGMTVKLEVAVVVIVPAVVAAAAALLLGEAAALVVKPAGRVTPFSAAQVATSRP